LRGTSHAAIIGFIHATAFWRRGRPVWELICHHFYCWGTIAADRSPWGSHGQSHSVQPLADHIGLHFPEPQSRIVIPPTQPWQVLTGIRVEIVARLADTEGWLIDGGESFGMYLNRGLLIAHGFQRDVINSFDSPLSLPIDRWVRLTFEHNGFNLMALFIDDTTAAMRPILHAIPGVGPQGVTIGNDSATFGGQLRGDIESVKVWRIDPRAEDREFRARPLDPAVAKCWDDFVRALREALRAHPECARWLFDLVKDWQGEVLQALAQKDQSEIDEFIKMTEQYRVLWRAGLLDTPQMLELAARFRSWLIAKGLVDRSDPRLEKLAYDRCIELLIKLLPSLECDPQVVALFKAFAGNPRPA
jgi:hypothetical protein